MDCIIFFCHPAFWTIKFIWITINGLSVYSDDGQFLNRWNFSYELMFKFDTETLEIFDVQKK